MKKWDGGRRKGGILELAGGAKITAFYIVFSVKIVEG